MGGEKADIREHPWQVAFSIGTPGSPMLCGGSLVADRWVLTAAHCFHATAQPDVVRVKAGASDYRQRGGWGEAEKIVMHEGYDAKTHENDLALVKLKSPPAGEIIPLATPEVQPHTCDMLEVTGWGRTAEGAPAAAVLQRASVPYVENSICNAPEAYKGAIKDGMMCAGYHDGGVDACQGDSGGPLVLRGADGPVLIGVVSWGEGCARKLKFGVYTRVSAYRDWIAKTIVSDPD